MPFNNAGIFCRLHNWEDDRINNIDIASDRHDEEDDNFAEGLTQCFLKNGNSAMEGDLNVGNYKIRNLSVGTASGDAINKSQLDALNTTLTTAISTAITNCKDALFPVGSVYATIGNTNPNTLLGFGTWTNIAATLVTTLAATAPVKGNGKSMGITDGSTTKSMLSGRTISSQDRQGLFTSATYSSSSLSATGSESAFGGNSLLGLTTDSTKSGIIADTSSLATEITVYLWQRTA